MLRRILPASIGLFALTFSACSSGLGEDPNAEPEPTPAVANPNLPLGFALGFTPTDPIAEPAIAGLVVPAIGSTPAREVLLLGFSTAAVSSDGDGAGTPLSRDATTDTNGSADVFVAAVSSAAIETDAFSQRLAGKFRHPRCTTCHSMQASDTQAFVSSPQPHAGPPPGATFPNNDPTTCAPCHVTSTHFPVEGWMAPAASFDIRPKTVAQLVQMAQNVPAGETEHFVTDRRVLWALDSGVLPAVNGRNGIADDDHDGVLEPEDTDGTARTVPGGSTAFLADIEAWHAAGDPIDNRDAVVDVTLVSRVPATSTAGNGASTGPRLRWVPNSSFDPTNATTAAATNPIGTLYVAFESTASDLAGSDSNGVADVFRAVVELRAEEDENGNAEAGGLNLRTLSGSLVLASARDGSATVGNAASTAPSIGGSNGEVIVFTSAATNLVTAFTDANGSGTDVFARTIGANTTVLVSHTVGNLATGGDGTSSEAVVDPTGDVVAFSSAATDMIAVDSNGVTDVFYARIDNAAPFTKVRASVNGSGAPGTGGACGQPSVQVDGSRVLVAFASAKTDLATVTATNNVFLFDSSSGATTLLNQRVTTDGTTVGDGDARHPVLAADGSVICFESDAGNLDVLRDDGNRHTDVFLVEVDQLADGLVLPFRISVSVDHAGDGNGDSTDPVLGVFTGSANYQVGFAAYRTTATNLGTADGNDFMLALLDETSGVIVDFEASATRGAIPFTVTFTDRSSGNPTSWAWDFDNDGNVDATTQNPSHTFTAAGTYSVRLVARNANREGTLTNASMIRALGPVVPSFTASTTAGPAPLAVTFTDTSTEEPTAWAWDFEADGVVDATTQNPSHTYTTPGTYSVRLAATNEHSQQTTTSTGLITVYTQVVAEFSGTPLTGTNPLQVAFTNLTTGDAASYAWDFDGDTITDSTAANPTHTYATPGSYTVRLTATGPGGTDTETKAGYVVVSGLLTADFSASATREYNTTSIQFTDTSSGSVSPTSWAWDFQNDGSTDSTLQNPTFTFTTPGTYSVKLTVSGPGASDVELKSNFFVSVPSSVSLTVEAAKDGSIYSENTDRGNGGNAELVCGNAATLTATQVGIRRAFVEFDVAAVVPADADILTASLQLTCTYAPTNPTGAQTVSIRPVTTEWGEAGTSAGIGIGATATAGDVTWAQAVAGTTAWTTPGGDTDPLLASTTVNGTGTYTWATSSNFVDLVQDWLDTPGDNHGLQLRAGETAGVRTAKVFGSRENATSASRPKLILTYRPAL